jgi:hypothetical protein
MADEQTRPPYSRAPIVPPDLGWPSLLEREGEELADHYHLILEELGKRGGMLGEIFRKARSEVQNLSTLKRLIVDLIGSETWMPMQADVKGDLYEGLLHDCDVHTLLRLPTGVFYAQGVKANVLFFENRPGREQAWTKDLWVYDLRTNMHFTLKQNPLRRADMDEFVALYKPANRHEREPSWSEDNPGGRWRRYEYDELLKRDKVNLDLTWLRDESLEDSANLPPPEMIAAEIVADLQAALDQFSEIAELLRTQSP